MNQKKSTYNTIILILFGVALFSATNVIIKSLIHFYFHYGLSHRFVEIHFNYYVPAFSFVATLIFSFLTYILLKKKLQKWQNGQNQYPIVWILILIIIAIVTDPFIQIVSDKKLNLLYEDLSRYDYLSRLNFDIIFNAIDYSVYGSKWLVFIFVFIFCLYELRKQNKKNL